MNELVNTTEQTPIEIKECLTITKFYDTNALLNLQEAAFKERFYISDETLREIENIKTSSRKDEDIKYKARHVARLLDQNHDQYSVINYNFEMEKQLLNYELDPDKPDNRIVYSAYLLSKNTDIEFISDDLCCKNIARKIFNLPVHGITEPMNEIYKGYKVIKGDTDIINQSMADMDYSTWHTNEYLIIENTDDGTTKEMRYDGQGFVSLKLPSSKFIKAKNSLQRCALDILNNPDITTDGYEELDELMELYCDGIWFKIVDPPTISNNGMRETKEITAESYEIMLTQYKLKNFKINMGEEDSYEMMYQATHDKSKFYQIKFYDPDNEDLSFLHLVLKHADVPGWKIGYVDNITPDDDGKLLPNNICNFEVDDQNVYAFLTQEAAQGYKCVFEFDTVNMTINVYRPDSLGKDTNMVMVLLLAAVVLLLSEAENLLML